MDVGRACVMDSVGDQDVQNSQPSAGQTIGDSDIVPAGAGLDTVSSSGNMAFIGGSDNDTVITSRTDEFSAGREGSPRLSPLVTPVAGNYSPPFWEILLDTVTAESPTGEG
jgi:hypothetical protein